MATAKEPMTEEGSRMEPADSPTRLVGANQIRDERSRRRDAAGGKPDGCGDCGSPAWVEEVWVSAAAEAEGSWAAATEVWEWA